MTPRSYQATASLSVLPVPEDYPEHVHMTGYWSLDRDAAW
jgi:hypothetical protein